MHSEESKNNDVFYKGICKYSLLSSDTDANNCFDANQACRTTTTLTDNKWIFPLPAIIPKTVGLLKQRTWQNIYRLGQPIRAREKYCSLGVKFWKYIMLLLNDLSRTVNVETAYHLVLNTWEILLVYCVLSVFFFSRTTKQIRFNRFDTHSSCLGGKQKQYCLPLYVWTSWKCMANTTHFCYDKQSFHYSKHTNIDAIRLSRFLFFFNSLHPYCFLAENTFKIWLIDYKMHHTIWT